MNAKRKLNFENADQVIKDIESLRSAGYQQLKNWNLTQICDHLTRVMVGEMDGLGFRLPWILRRTVGVMMTNHVLKKRRMPTVPTLPSMKPEPQTHDSEEVINACVAAVRRTESFAGSLADYPFVDGLTHDQWRQFMWIHAAHHLGYLIPNCEGS